MLDRILTLVCCVFFPVGLIIVAAIWGTITRIRITRKILTGIKDGQFRDLASPNKAKRIRMYAVIEMMLLSGIVLLSILVISKVIPFDSSFTILIYSFLVIIGTAIGLALYKEILGEVDR